MESELVSLHFITINKGHLQEPPGLKLGTVGIQWNSQSPPDAGPWPNYQSSAPHGVRIPTWPLDAFGMAGPEKDVVSFCKVGSL